MFFMVELVPHFIDVILNFTDTLRKTTQDNLRCVTMSRLALPGSFRVRIVQWSLTIT